MPMEIQISSDTGVAFTLAQWHSDDRLVEFATGTNAFILANPVPLRNLIRNSKRQQWQTDIPKKLTTLPQEKCVTICNNFGVFSELSLLKM